MGLLDPLVVADHLVDDEVEELLRELGVEVSVPGQRAQPLDPEKSRNYSLGTVIRFGSFEATIDAYRIDIRDRIVLSENLNTPQVAALIAPFGASVMAA